jgi:hypothetical protein
MKPDNTRAEANHDDMLPEYDFSNKTGVRGKYYRALQSGYTVTVHHADGRTTVKEYQPKSPAITLDPDVSAYFPDAESVNNALRSLIALIPEKRKKSRSVRNKNKSE